MYRVICLFWPLCAACRILVPQPGIEPWARGIESMEFLPRNFLQGGFKDKMTQALGLLELISHPVFFSVHSLNCVLTL